MPLADPASHTTARARKSLRNANTQTELGTCCWCKRSCSWLLSLSVRIFFRNQWSRYLDEPGPTRVEDCGTKPPTVPGISQRFRGPRTPISGKSSRMGPQAEEGSNQSVIQTPVTDSRRSCYEQPCWNPRAGSTGATPCKSFHLDISRPRAHNPANFTDVPDVVAKQGVGVGLF
jgi:hypothetical protein